MASFDQAEYNAYINSRQWRNIREEAIKRANYCCESCGISKWSVKLEVHHKTYERFKRERLDDLKVLCPSCHQQADVVRAKLGKIKSQRALNNARFNGWASKVFGDDWECNYDEDFVSEKYDEWCQNKAAMGY